MFCDFLTRLLRLTHFILGNSHVPGKTVATALSRSPTWTPIIGDSVYHSSSFFPLTTSNNAFHLLAQAINHMLVECAPFEYLILPHLLGTKNYMMDTYRKVALPPHMSLHSLMIPQIHLYGFGICPLCLIYLITYYFVLIWKVWIVWSRRSPIMFNY